MVEADGHRLAKPRNKTSIACAKICVKVRQLSGTATTKETNYGLSITFRDVKAWDEATGVSGKARHPTRI